MARTGPAHSLIQKKERAKILILQNRGSYLYPAP